MITLGIRHNQIYLAEIDVEVNDRIAGDVSAVIVPCVRTAGVSARNAPASLKKLQEAPRNPERAANPYPSMLSAVPS